MMKNRIDTLFQTKRENILSVYMTAGYPALEDTVPVIKTLEASGVDLIEVGMPFSDPLADGPVIQQSSTRALRNGMTLETLFDQLADIREQVGLPLVLMGYLNPVLHYGMKRFLKKAREVGVDGVILPDLPLLEYQTHYQSMFDEAGIPLIMLITPQTSPERIHAIASASGGFLYMVSDASTTGARDGISEQQEAYFRRIAEMKLDIPRLIGFGISNHETFTTACQYASGAIIGSAFIRALDGEGSTTEKVRRFVDRLLHGE